MPGDRRKPRIAGQQRRAESLRQRKIGGVVRGQVVPKLPDPFQQRLVPVSLDGHGREVRERVAPLALVEVSARGATPEGVGNLDVQHVRSVQRVVALEEPFFEGGTRVGAEKHLDHDRRVDDDQRLSRS